MSLRALQRDMRAWLLHEDPLAAGRVGEGATAGLAVYLNNFRAQLIACLEASFPQTRAWIGDDAFLHAAVCHIDRVPPSSWTLDAYAMDFPTTLAALHADDPEIAEIARIELAMEEMFVSADQAALGIDHLGDIDWDHAELCISPSIELIALFTNGLAIWSALATAQTPPPAIRLDIAETALVWRQDHRARIRALATLEHQALLKVRAGMSFATLCAATVDAFGEKEGTGLAGQWLGRWIADGLIAGIRDPAAVI